jgi:hypothetical protein
MQIAPGCIAASRNVKRLFITKQPDKSDPKPFPFRWGKMMTLQQKVPNLQDLS